MPRAAYARPEEPVFYEDEMDVHINPKVGPDWMLAGERREVATPGNNQKRYVAGALNSRTGELTWVKGERKTSALFIELARAVSNAYPTARRLHFILDNAATHSSRQTKKVLAQMSERVVLRFLPPYCLPRGQPHRAGLVGRALQRHPQPPVQEDVGAYGRGGCLPGSAQLAADFKSAAARGFLSTRSMRPFENHGSSLASPGSTLQ